MACEVSNSFFERFYLFIFRERKRGREMMCESNIDQLPLGNPAGELSLCRMMPNQLSRTSQGSNNLNPAKLSNHILLPSLQPQYAPAVFPHPILSVPQQRASGPLHRLAHLPALFFPQSSETSLLAILRPQVLFHFLRKNHCLG